MFKPSNAAYATWRNEKIFQVSSDTAPTTKRDTANYNNIWCAHAFTYKMMFQAHTNSSDAASGIKQNHPTPLEPLIIDPVVGGGDEVS
ncbi:MAG TPA: hypothetical protein VEX60_16970 [Pyrinomonadaceae bacterium]|nr:hypothetical protein [Pyrinomonadaceae bacterium]